MSCYLTSYWALDETRIDPEVFFRTLPRHLPEATTLYIEGTCIAEDVKAVLLSHAQTGPYLPNPGETDGIGTYLLGCVGLRTDRFRCEFSPSLLSELEQQAKHHAEPELCDHLFVFEGNEPILLFYDFPQNELWLPIKMSEERVRALASDLNTTYQKVDDG